MLTQNRKLKDAGGAELQQLLIGKELVRRGFDVSIISAAHKPEEIRKDLPFKIVPAFKPGAGLPLIRFFYPKLVKIWRALCSADADIFYVRGGGFILAPVVFYAKLKHKKVVFCGADDTDFDPKRVQLPIFRDRMFYYWGIKRCDKIVVQNKAQRKLLQENFNKKGEIIRNGFYKTNHNSAIRNEILWVATIRKKKNPQLFIELAKRFPKEKFVMIGGRVPGNYFERQDLFDYITEKAKEVPNLEFKGFLPFEETDKQFARAKLFINTSMHEGFPNTLLQAWSRGIPVISFVNPDDLIGKYPLGVAVKNFEEMVQKLQEVLSKRIRFSQQKIKTFFEKNLTIENTVDKYEILFNHLVSK